LCLGRPFSVKAHLPSFGGRNLEGGDEGDIEAVANIGVIQMEVVRVLKTVDPVEGTG